MAEEKFTVADLFDDSEGVARDLRVEVVDVTTGEVVNCTFEEVKGDRHWIVPDEDVAATRKWARAKRKTWALNQQAAEKLKAVREK